MAQDFRRGAAKITPRRTRSCNCVWWFLFGVLTGSFGVGLYWMTQEPGRIPAPVAAIPKIERPAPEQTKFQFEKILRETVVDSSDNGKPPPPPAPRPEPPPPPAAEPPPADAPKPETAAPAAAGRSVLQVGSFKTAKEAESMKAQLALNGVSTRVQKVTLKNGQVWHRVMTGPLDGKKGLDQTRATLKKHGHDAVVIKVK
jgi:cell division protein FtsN